MKKQSIVSLYSFGCYTELMESLALYNFFNKLMLLDNSDLLDRLCRKYVKRDAVNETITLLKKHLADLSAEDKKILCNLISACEDGARGSELSFKTFGEYEPLRLVILDEPYRTLSDKISLEDYDNNDGEPFWMRPEYIVEKYGKNTRLRIDTVTPTSREHKATYIDGKLVK